MTRPSQRVYQRALGVAVELKTAPSFSLLGKGKNPNTVKWSLRDRMLFASVLQLNSEKCPQCGTPMWLGHTYSNEVEFDVKFSICHACEELAERTKDLKLPPGEYAHVHARGLIEEDGTESALPSRSVGYSKMDEPEHPTND